MVSDFADVIYLFMHRITDNSSGNYSARNTAIA